MSHDAISELKLNDFNYQIIVFFLIWFEIIWSNEIGKLKMEKVYEDI